MLTFAFGVQPARGSENYVETIYIRADGSVDPSSVPISTVDNITYVVTDNSVNLTLVVERSNIIIDGNGYTLLGPLESGADREYSGLEPYGVIVKSFAHNVTIQNMTIRGYFTGIFLNGSRYNKIIGNNVEEVWDGISLYMSSNNTVSGNQIPSEWFMHGIILDSSSNNTISENTLHNGYYHICCGLGSSNNKILGNRMYNIWGTGIWLRGSYNTVVGNDIDDHQPR